MCVQPGGKSEGCSTILASDCDAGDANGDAAALFDGDPTLLTRVDAVPLGDELLQPASTATRDAKPLAAATAKTRPTR
jgi:hypothetical protein